MHHKVTVTTYRALTYFANCESQLNKSAEESRPGYPYVCMTMHLLTGYTIDSLIYLNPDLKKCDIHHILLNWLAPSDYHLFPNSKKHLRGQKFSTKDEIKCATEEWQKEQSELF